MPHRPLVLTRLIASSLLLLGLLSGCPQPTPPPPGPPPVQAERLSFSAAPTSATAGSPLSPLEVTVLGSDGAPFPDSNASVTLSLAAGPQGATLQGTLTVQAVQGVARFTDVVLRQAGSGYTLRATATGLTEATSSAFNVAPAAPASLTLEQLPAQVSAGVAASAEVRVLDAFGNLATQYTGSVTFSSSDPTAELPAAYTFTAADAGRRTFLLTLKRAGAQRVTVADTTASLSATADTQVLPAVAAQLVFTRQPANGSVRAPLAPVEVALQDAYGNRTVATSPDVTVELVQGGSVLEGVTTVTPASGVATFDTLSLTQQGTYSLRATATGLANATSADFEIVDDIAPDQPVFSSASSTPSTITVQWTAVGDDGLFGTATSHELRYSTRNIVTDGDFDAATPVTLAPPQAPGSAEQATVEGLLPRTTYYLALRVADDAGNATLSDALRVTTQALPASRLAFTQQPSNGTAGSALPAFTVAVQNANGELVAVDGQTVTLTLQGATGWGPFTAQTAGGIATFNSVRIDRAGTGYSFEATSGSLTPATSSTFSVAPAAARRLLLAYDGQPKTAGTEFPVSVTAYDDFDNVATGYTGTVAFSSTDTLADLPASYAFTTADEGRRTFSLTLKRAGSQQLTVADSAASISSSLSIQVVPAAATRLAFTRQPANGVAGTPLDPIQVSLRDEYDNLVPTDGEEVTLTLQGATGSFIAQTVGGVASFDALRINRAGTGYTFLATSGSLTEATSTSFDIAPGAAARLELVASAGPYVAGSAFQATVTAYDAYDNQATGYTGTIAFSSGDAQAVLPLPYTFTPADSGSRTFDVELRTSGSQALSVADTINPALRAELTLPVAPGAAARLAFGTQPDNGFIIQPLPASTVVLRDAYGNATTASSPDVTMSLTGGDPAATLSGTLSVTPAAGVATFSNLRVDRPAASYQLVASAPGLTGTTSSAFDVSDPCFGVTCPPPAPGCSADGTSVETYEGFCDPASQPVCRGRLATTARCALGQVCRAGACEPSTPADQRGRIIITEFRSLGEQFIELRNTTASSIDIRGFTLENFAGQLATIRAPNDPSGANSTPVVVPAGGVLYGVANPSGGPPPASVGFLYGEPGTSFALSGAGDSLGLFSPLGLEDMVDFRTFVSDPNVAPGPAFVGLTGRSTQLDPLSASATGNDSATAWCVSFFPASGPFSRVDDTAGAPNGSCSAVVINEALIDPSGTDDGKAFIELAGPGGAVLSGMRLRDLEGVGTSAGSTNAADIVLPAGLRLPADGLLIVADALADGTTLVPGVTPGVDLVVPDADFENSGGDSLQLVSAGGTLLDAVGHDANGNPLTRLTDQMLNLPMYETATALYPPINGSLARSNLSTDTGDNSADFRGDPTSTPGQPNGTVSVSITQLVPNDTPVNGSSTIDITGTDLYEGIRLQFGTNTTTIACTLNSSTSARCSAPTANVPVPAVVDVTVNIPPSLKLPNIVLAQAFTYTNHLNEGDLAEEADFCNLQFPASVTLSSGQTSPIIYGRLYEAGLTEAPGAPAGLIAEVGYGDANSNPTVSGSWRFFPAAYNVQVGNDDEFQGTFPAPTVTTPRNFSYTFRFSRDGGLSWTYCDRNGAGSNAGLTLETTQLGSAAVNP